MNTTTRSTFAAAALALAVSPLVLAAPASAERLDVTDGAVASSGRDAGADHKVARQQQQAYVDRLDAAARDAQGGARPGTSPLAPAQGGDDGVPVSVVTLLTLGGMAVGAGATLGLRRVQVPGRRQVAAA
jgi:hypothetical protein